MVRGTVFFTLLVISAFLTAFSGTAAGAVIYVPDDQPTIQDAIDNSQNGDTIVVRPGTYTENVDFKGKAVLLESEKGPESTVIDAGRTGSAVIFVSNEGPDAVLEGFTLTNGSGTYAPAPFNGLCGGAVFCETSSPTIRGNVITLNEADYGGGVCCSAADAFISGNAISDNTAGNGGGIFSRHSSVEITANTITGNTVSYGGGGISVWLDSAPVITDNIVSGNTAGSGGGGGIRCYNTTTPLLVNNTITGNTADSGGGLYIKNCSVTMANSILWGDSAPEGPEISIVWTAKQTDLTVDHSDVEGGQALVYILSPGILNWNAGMLDTDPLFAAAEDYHLREDSPCRDAGDGSIPSLPAVDFENDPRSAQSSVDMGADEFYFHLYATGDTVPGNTVKVNVVGFSGMPVTLYLGSGIQDPPQPSIYGDIYINLPPLASWKIGKIPQSGILTLTTAVPLSWIPGDEKPLQALVGRFGRPYTRVTNLMLLVVD